MDFWHTVPGYRHAPAIMYLSYPASNNRFFVTGAHIRLQFGDLAGNLEGPIVEFRLTYEGRLASATSCSVKHKHDVRRAFHPQLKTFWGLHPWLIDQSAWHPSKYDAPSEKGYKNRIEQLANYFRRGPYCFVPLVNEELRLLCHLDILFLRPGPPGQTLSAGDIDNRVKTLLDALKVPDGVPTTPPDADEDPFYVLLQDDSLVSRLSVETDTLLQPTGPEAGLQDARLVITVRLQPYSSMLRTVGM
jgi:hypothetical protein